MIRLLFISHTGNNEPPMAQCIMDHLIQKAGLTDSLSVSAASFAKEGAPLSKPAQETLSAHGIPYTMKKTFPIAWKTYDDYDFILLMNDKNNPDIFNTMGGDVDEKIHLLSEYAGKEADIPNPHKGAAFEDAYEEEEKSLQRSFEEARSMDTVRRKRPSPSPIRSIPHKKGAVKK